jgi:hypothetical protein
MGKMDRPDGYRHDRATEYGGFRQSTTDKMAEMWTNSNGQWLDPDGNVIKDLTFDHVEPVVQHWNRAGQ